MWMCVAATLRHKYVNVDVNPNKKSERQEWATACYNAYYSPLCVFELQIQWMVATGSLLGDMVSVCMCVRERESVCVCVCVCVRERERECVCVCVCV